MCTQSRQELDLYIYDLPRSMLVQSSDMNTLYHIVDMLRGITNVPNDYFAPLGTSGVTLL